MTKKILILASFLFFNLINAQCNTSLIKAEYDEFDKKKTNKGVLYLSNEKGVECKMELSFCGLKAEVLR